MIHRRLAVTTLIGFALAAATLPASGQWAVFDARNFSQNILTAARTLQQINNQIQQIQNEARMLANDARNLAGLDFNTVAQLRAALARTTRLIAEAQGMGFRLARVEAEFARLHPPAYGAGTTAERMLGDSRERWAGSLEAIRTTLLLQAQAAENLPVDEDAIAALVEQSQGAVGQLQALQANNQLLALHARQLIQEQQLRIAQDRAGALEHARALAAEDRAREVRRRFLGEGTRYTPQFVRFYGD